MRKRRWNKNRKKSRYGAYFEAMMDPIWREHWENDLKRIKKLKKQLEKLGPIPTKEVQLIKTANLFVDLINLLTTFVDEGNIPYAPEDKYDAVDRFKHVVSHYVAREDGTLCYINKSEPGKRVTANNLCIGLFSSVAKEDITNNIKTKTINGITIQVLAEFTPIVNWINQNTTTLDGSPASLSQKAIASYIKDIKEAVLKEIDKILA